MHRCLAAVTFAFALVTVAPAESARAKAEGLYRATMRHLLAKDVDAFERAMKPYVTKEFVYVEGKRSMDFDKMIEGMRQGLGGLSKVTESTAKVAKVVEKRDRAAVRVKQSVAGTLASPDGKTHTLSFGGTMDLTWVKVKGRWKLARMQWVELKQMFDGKEIAAPADGL